MSERKLGSVFFAMMDTEQRENFIKEFERQADINPMTISPFGTIHLKDTGESVNHYIGKSYINFGDFISGAFVFTISVEGGAYWRKLITHINGEQNISRADALMESISEAVEVLGTFSDEDPGEYRLICGREFYNLMTREERSDYHDEFTSQRSNIDFDNYLDICESPSFVSFISGSFGWAESRRGHLYWSNISEKYGFNHVYEVLDELNITTDGTPEILY